MRYIYSFFVLMLLCACYTAKKAEKQIDKAHRVYPVVTANKYQSWYPVSIDSHEVIKWRMTIDTLFNDIYHDSIIVDTITNEKVVTIYKKINVIRDRCLQSPIIYRIDSAKIFLMQDKINKAEIQAEKYHKKYKIFFYLTIAFLLLFLLLWIYYLIKRK